MVCVRERKGGTLEQRRKGLPSITGALMSLSLKGCNPLGRGNEIGPTFEEAEVVSQIERSRIVVEYWRGILRCSHPFRTLSVSLCLSFSRSLGRDVFK